MDRSTSLLIYYTKQRVWIIQIRGKLVERFNGRSRTGYDVVHWVYTIRRDAKSILIKLGNQITVDDSIMTKFSSDRIFIYRTSKWKKKCFPRLIYWINFELLFTFEAWDGTCDCEDVRSVECRYHGVIMNSCQLAIPKYWLRFRYCTQTPWSITKCRPLTCAQQKTFADFVLRRVAFSLAPLL